MATEKASYKDQNKKPENTTDNIPQWQIDEIRKRKEYYALHPEELIDWDTVLKN